MSTRLPRTVLLLIALAAVVVLLAPAAAVRADGTRAIDQQVDRHLAAAPANRAAGAVIADGAVTTFARGGADPHSRFRIASMSKSFTAALVMIEVQRGRVGLDDPVTDHLPDLRLADGRQGEITVRMLLSHTSGLSDRGYRELDVPAPRSSGELLTRLSRVRLTTQPGSRHEYLNTNYALAAVMLERIAGRPYAEILHRDLFGPLQMTDSTSVQHCGDPVDGVGPGHAVVLGRPIPVGEPDAFCLGDGGIIASATDLATWLRFQLDGGVTRSGQRVLDPASIRTIFTVQPGTAAGGGGYGLGWGIGPGSTGDLVAGHGGALSGWSSAMSVAMSDGMPSGAAAVVLTDTAGARSSSSSALLTAATGGDPGPPTGSSQLVVDLIALAVTLVVAVLGVRGLLRSRRWAVRTASPARRAVGLVVPSAVAVLGVGWAPLLAVVVGTPLNWLGSWAYTMAMLPLLGLLGIVLAAAGVVVATARAAAGHRSWRGSGTPR